ncbi:hypothetical protein Tco_0841082 [Tanacetum coccineum]|uniref:Ribosomal protein S13 n=1 Tax=Tanacetum coccineum TaxID=301880 RepID=A0ABQ5AVD6_9ASTR
MNTSSLTAMLQIKGIGPAVIKGAVRISLKDLDGIIRKNANFCGRCITQKKGTNKAIRVRALVMTSVLDLSQADLEAQIEARKPGKLKFEHIGGIVD